MYYRTYVYLEHSYCNLTHSELDNDAVKIQCNTFSV